MRLQTYGSREEWLQGRQGRIGGSDAAATVGASPYMTNVQLWEIKTGRRQQADISDSPLVWYGTHAEDHLRELFRLDFPDYEVFYQENNLWTNEKYPFAHASLDGWLKDGKGRNGIFECKTATITSAVQRAKWKDQIPQNYYIQCIHYMMVTEFDFAILKAQLKTEWPGQLPSLSTEHYLIERSEVQQDIDRLTAVLSGILSDRFGKDVNVTMEGKNDNSNSVSNNSVSGRSAQFHSLHDAV